MGDQKAKPSNGRLSLRNLGGRARQANSGRQVLPATPAARRYAAEKGVDLQELSEIGKERRITERDIDIYLEKKKIFEKHTQNGRRQEAQETLDQPEEPKLKAAADNGGPQADQSQAAEPESASQPEPGAEASAEAPPQTEPDIQPESIGETETEKTEAPAAPEVKTESEQPDAAEAPSVSETKEKSSGFNLDDFDPNDVTIVSVSPLARELAEEHHVDLSKLTPGSGPNGRIVRYDVRQWLKAHPDETEAASQPVVHKPMAQEKPAPKEEQQAAPAEQVQMQPEPEKLADDADKPKADLNLGHHDPVAAKIYQAIRDNMGDTFTQKTPPQRAKAQDVMASAMAEQESPQDGTSSDLMRREDPADTAAVGPYSLDITADVTRVHDACRNQAENGSVELTDYVTAAAARSMSLHPKACGEGSTIVLMTLSESKGLVCTPALDADEGTSPQAISKQRCDAMQKIEEGRLNGSDCDAGLHIMSLGQGVGVNYICDKQKAPILAVGAVRKEMQIGGMHYIAALTLSQKRGAANVAASVAFLNALKTFLENPDALIQLKPKEEK